MASPRREKHPLQSSGVEVDGETEYSATRWQRKPPSLDASSTFAWRRPSAFMSLNLWKWELLSLVGCLAILSATFVTLYKFNEQDLPDWPISLNLNSLVAIYTTILRALLLFPLAESKSSLTDNKRRGSDGRLVISQEKWAWFRRPRPLRHLDSFEFASRGAWGGLELIRISFRP